MSTAKTTASTKFLPKFLIVQTEKKNTARQVSPHCAAMTKGQLPVTWAYIGSKVCPEEL